MGRTAACVGPGSKQRRSGLTLPAKVGRRLLSIIRIQLHVVYRHILCAFFLSKSLVLKGNRYLMALNILSSHDGQLMHVYSVAAEATPTRPVRCLLSGNTNHSGQPHLTAQPSHDQQQTATPTLRHRHSMCSDFSLPRS